MTPSEPPELRPEPAPPPDQGTPPSAATVPKPYPPPDEEPEDWVAFRQRELLANYEQRVERAGRYYDHARFVW